MAYTHVEWNSMNPDDVSRALYSAPIEPVQTGETKKVTVVWIKSDRSIRAEFKYVVCNKKGMNLLLEDRDNAQGRSRRSNLAAFHISQRWNISHNKEFLEKYEIENCDLDYIYSVHFPTKPTIPIGDCVSHDSDEEYDPNNDLGTYAELERPEDFRHQSTLYGHIANRTQRILTGHQDHTLRPVTHLSEAYEMVQAGLEGSTFKTHSAFVVEKAFNLTLTEIRKGISKSETVISLRERYPDQVVFFPLGVTERGYGFSGHTVLVIITPKLSMIVDSNSFALYGDTESYKTQFQGMMDTTNCSRLAAFTILEIIHQLDWDKLNEKNADLKKEDITALFQYGKITKPSQEQLDILYENTRHKKLTPTTNFILESEIELVPHLTANNDTNFSYAHQLYK